MKAIRVILLLLFAVASLYVIGVYNPRFTNRNPFQIEIRVYQSERNNPVSGAVVEYSTRGWRDLIEIPHTGSRLSKKRYSTITSDTDGYIRFKLYDDYFDVERIVIDGEEVPDFTGVSLKTNGNHSISEGYLGDRPGLRVRKPNPYFHDYELIAYRTRRDPYPDSRSFSIKNERVKQPRPKFDSPTQ